MSDSTAARFWDNALAPYIQTLVWPRREQAQARLTLDATHGITALTLATG